MATGTQHIERIVVVGGRRWRRGLTSRHGVTTMPAISVVPEFDPPSTGGFVSRKDRGRYHAHLEALLAVQASGAAVAVVAEGTVPSPAALAQIDRVVGALPAGWTIEFLEPRLGRRRPTASARLYVVSALGAREVHDHLSSVLNGPRDEAHHWDALQRAFESLPARSLSLAS